VVEVTLLAPWIFFLFAGAFDVGMYSYALISAQNAARAGATYTSRSSTTAADSDGACQYALQELKGLSNVRPLSVCDGAPLRVTASAITGVDGAPASSVSVEYQTEKLIPIPGLAGQFTFRRTVQMKVK
jgi:Flp pilus assembly protein TadG